MFLLDPKILNASSPNMATDVHIPLDHYTGEPRDFAYVQYPFFFLKSLIFVFGFF